jgi:hypothetical protein
MAAAFRYPMEQVFLARHGETEWNRIRRRQGQLNSPLTRGALAQATGGLTKPLLRCEQARSGGGGMTRSLMVGLRAARRDGSC